MPTQILIADDNPDDVKLLELALRAQPGVAVELHYASDGVSALEAVRGGSSFHLVVLDYYLPKMHALEIAEALLKSGDFPACPVVVLTSHLQQDRRLALLDAGVRMVVEKPGDWDAFLELGALLRTLSGAK